MNPELWREVDRILGEALELSSPDQLAFVESRCAGKPALRAEVLSLLAAVEDSAGFIPAHTFAGAVASPIAAQDLRGQRIGSYIVLDEIGRGGMGTVYSARRADEQFEKTVAIKVLEPGLQTRQSLRRFESERHALAALDHPNITRLLDSGVTGDGIPYIVMEFVAGTRIELYCQTQKLDIPSRLRLFCSVCDAVQFAHQRLVVHRDIKGENILITADGTPKLLDFGIAKFLQSAALPSTAQTIAHWQPMTLDSASPEQLRGEPVTTATDVYSLGVLLYKLIAGHPPYSLQGLPLTEVVNTVCEQDPAPPGVSEDLDAIIRKAMRKEPAQRYGSVADFSHDIGLYLTQHPVLAHRGSFQYVAGKFFRRNWQWVTAAAIVLLLATAGVAGVLWQARIANLERASAQRRFEEVRRLARSVLFEFHDGVAALPGSTAVRRLMVTRALDYLDRLATESGQDQDLALELAAGYERVGRVQGDPNLANLGDSAAAIASMEKARGILAALITADDRDRQLRARLAMASLLETMSALQIGRGDFPASRSLAEEALHLREGLLSLSPANPDRQTGLANAHFAVANALQAGKIPGATAHRQRAVDIYESQLAAAPANGGRQRSAALIHKVTGGALIETDHRAALPHLQRALVLDEQRLAARPVDTLAQMDVAIDLSQLSAYLFRFGRPAEALPLIRRSISIRRGLLAADPKDARAQGRLVFALNLEARFLESRRDMSAARANYKEALRIASAVVAADPRDADAQRNRFTAVAGLARLGGGCDAARQARDGYKTLSDRGLIRDDERVNLLSMEKSVKALHCME